MDFLHKVYEKAREIYGPRHFAALILLLFIISAVGLTVGTRYSSYIRKSPEYCNSCHLMKETFDGWRASSHKSVTCQQCHKLGLVEQNSLLVKYVVYGPEKVSQKHGKKLPWETCSGCHWEQKDQGGDSPEQSYGHYRHSFLQCFNCHPYAGHSFPDDPNACSRCHKDKDVHGSGMEEFVCTACHIFNQREGTQKNRVVPTRQRCMKCHEDALKDEFPQSAPMAKLECFDCHDPHGQIVLPDSACVECHKKDIKDNAHKRHPMPCGRCHKAHEWVVSDPKSLCASCHAFRPIEAFK